MEKNSLPLFINEDGEVDKEALLLFFRQNAYPDGIEGDIANELINICNAYFYMDSKDCSVELLILPGWPAGNKMLTLQERDETKFLAYESMDKIIPFLHGMISVLERFHRKVN